jgi:endonuclease YncB( thermonuclease family)/uncharacterized protein YxeA
MKKTLLLLVVFSILFTLAGCTNSEDSGSGEYYVLPDLNGKTREQIEESFNSIGQNFEIELFDEENQLYENKFIMYIDNNTGDIVDKEDIVTILIYPPFTGERTFVLLPDLTGLNKNEIEDYFDLYEMNVSFSETLESTPENEGLFVGYGGFYEIGDQFFLTSVVSVIVYGEYIEESLYFYPIEMEYDGPYLDEIYANIDPIDPRGGYFDVDLFYCSDGDTAVFDYPTEIYNEITSGAKSTRFLNMDTEETFSGGEEEWGKPGSVYTCLLLESAVEIRLQTDPGDALTGTYGRLLSWIWIKLPGEEEFFLLNYMVVKQGLAQVKYEFGAGLDLEYDGTSYNSWMHIAEDYAKENDLGQWGDKLDYYWDYQNNQPYYTRWHE